MEISFAKIRSSDTNEAVLSIDDTLFPMEVDTLVIIHTNSEVGHYGNYFVVRGTEEELKIIQEFCEKITVA